MIVNGLFVVQFCQAVVKTFALILCSFRRGCLIDCGCTLSASAREKKTRGQFHKRSTHSFYICKFCAKLFCAYILGLYFIGARLLAQKLCIER